MQDVGLLTNEEIEKQLDAFYAFVGTYGYRYLTEDGIVHFNHLRSEAAIRAQESKAEDTQPA